MEYAYRSIIKQNESKPLAGDIRVLRIGTQFHVQEYVKCWWSWFDEWVDDSCFEDQEQAVIRAQKLVAEKHIPKKEVIWSER